MTTERIKEIQAETGYPDSVSVQQALLKVWNECEQEKVKKLDLTLVTKCALPERKPSVCRHCKSDDIYFDMDAGTWVCNECNEKAN